MPDRITLPHDQAQPHWRSCSVDTYIVKAIVLRFVYPA